MHKRNGNNNTENELEYYGDSVFWWPFFQVDLD